MYLDDVLAKNLRLKDLHAGRRCFIIGNGPSTKTQDLHLLRDEVSIAVNSFYYHSDAKIINPNYWVIADPIYWEKPDVVAKDFNLAAEKSVSPELFMASGGFDFFSKFNVGPLINLHFFHYDGSKDINNIIDFTQGIPPYGQNVVAVALMLAFYLGCSPIYFIGCDHDFMKVKKEEYENYYTQHFYYEPKHGKMIDWLTWEQYSWAMERMIYEYGQLNAYASLWGFQVFNATKGGYLDFFPRVEFESLFPRGYQTGSGNYSTEVTFNDPLDLGRSAVRLLNEGNNSAALALITEALRKNINRRNRVDGLEYLKSVCLARLKRYPEALVAARQDRDCNPVNRDKSETLIQQLESACSA